MLSEGSLLHKWVHNVLRCFLLGIGPCSYLIVSSACVLVNCKYVSFGTPSVPLTCLIGTPECICVMLK